MMANLFDEPVSTLPEIVLRPYQLKARSAVLAARDRGLERVIVVMPTGTGKTTLFSDLIGCVNEPSLVVAHRDELLTQAASRIAHQNPNLSVSIEGGDRKADFGSQVVVAGVQSIGRADMKRIPWFVPRFMIIDEAHHSPAESYQSVMRRFGSYAGECFTVGVTATDHRMDNKPLLAIARDIFEDVVYRYPLREAIQDGWLCDLRGYRVGTDIDLSKVKTTAGDYNVGQLSRAVNTEARNHAAYKHWSEVCPERRTIVFCVDVQHAKDVAEFFRERGVSCEAVDGSMKRDVRESAMRRFRDGSLQVLANVELVTEGVDVPEIACVLLLRPTQSWALFTQMVGRGLRLSDGKRDCIVIDVVDNTANHKLGERPEDKPGVAGLVGMPPSLDLKGNTLGEALEKFEEMPALQRGKLFARQCSFEDLSTAIQEVDLLAELSTPDELQGVTRLAWMKVAEGSYLLACGSEREGDEKNRMARILVDELGHCCVSLKSDSRTMPTQRIGDMQRAFETADRLVRESWPDCAGIVAARAAWRERPPSDGQMKYLRRLRVDAELIAQITTMGQASMLIEKHRGGRR